jgi:hypothetical protein
MDRDVALEYVTELIETVETGPLPVPVREVWVYGDVALGLDPIDRLDVYVTKDLLLGDDGNADADYESEFGLKGVGSSVSATWATPFPEHLRSNDAGYAAPADCLASYLLPDDEPVHLEVCNAGFEQNVRRRLEAALAREAYDQVLDPRGVCLWVEGTRSESALEKLRGGDLVLPTLPRALEMLGADDDEATAIADVLADQRADQQAASVRGDVV